jgi:hypothetical protein
MPGLSERSLLRGDVGSDDDDSNDGGDAAEHKQKP